MIQALIAPCLAANIFWFFLFSPATAGLMNFWAGMSVAAGSLALTAILAQRRNPVNHQRFKPSDMAIGIISAVILYGLFWAGHAISTRLLPFAHDQVVHIYATKDQLSPVLIALLLAFWIGPAEEIFWRGFVQQRLAGIFGANKGYMIATVLYAGVHVYAMNFMLFMAALICGAFWGYLYRRSGSLWSVIISHALWDVIIFVVLPIRKY